MEVVVVASTERSTTPSLLTIHAIGLAGVGVLSVRIPAAGVDICGGGSGCGDGCGCGGSGCGGCGCGGSGCGCGPRLPEQAG